MLDRGHRNGFSSCTLWAAGLALGFRTLLSRLFLALHKECIIGQSGGAHFMGLVSLVGNTASISLGEEVMGAEKHPTSAAPFSQDASSLDWLAVEGAVPM